MRFIALLFVFLLAHSGHTDGVNGKTYVVILSGGNNKKSNHMRYFENTRAMYSAARAMGVPSEDIKVLYGSGNVKDTNTGEIELEEETPAVRTQSRPSKKPVKVPAIPAEPESIRESSPYAGPSPQYGPQGVPPGGYVPMGYFPYYPPTPPPSGYGTYPELKAEAGACASCAVPVSPPPGPTVPVPTARPSGLDAAEEPIEPSSSKAPRGNSSDVSARLTEEYLFSGEKRLLDGSASAESLREQVRDLKSKVKPGDHVLMFITDHGSQDNDKESQIVLWDHQEMSAEELGEVLRDLPSSSKIHVVTNICYGGGLTKVTSQNVCVFSSQNGNKLHYSRSETLDRFGQDFPFAIKKRVGAGPDKKPNLMDAFSYATSMDKKVNEATTSLDYFLEQNRERILRSARDGSKVEDVRDEFCTDDSFGRDFKPLVNKLYEFDVARAGLGISLEGVPESRRDLIKGRLEQLVNAKSTDLPRVVDQLALRGDEMKQKLRELKAKWDTLDENGKKAARRDVQIESEYLRDQMNDIQSRMKEYKRLSLELNLLKYGDQDLIKQYRDIRKCLEYEY